MAFKIVGVIPARLNSTRLPRKVLLPILGKPMLHHVADRVREASVLDEFVVATDSEEVLGYCRQEKIPAMMTSASHPSGTDRVWEVSTKIKADVYVGIQADEPLVTAQHIELLTGPFKTPGVQVTTLKTAMTNEEAQNPNRVKVVTDESGRALYFSRAPIPFDREASGSARYFLHLGLYAYRREALEEFHRLSPSPLETIEKLEQLRFLEHGIPIHVEDTSTRTIGVDTEEDLRAVEQVLRSRRF
jgi:3-deoxy-manno-octulosonate cytidylyltransferase (CMP-KDO synthetase)